MTVLQFRFVVKFVLRPAKHSSPHKIKTASGGAGNGKRFVSKPFRPIFIDFSTGRRGFVRKSLKLAGPADITGAADDDPSGIAAYSQNGVQFGCGPLWTNIFGSNRRLTVRHFVAFSTVKGPGISDPGSTSRRPIVFSPPGSSGSYLRDNVDFPASLLISNAGISRSIFCLWDKPNLSSTDICPIVLF